jgi:N-acylneuraminate cytidylyltransferase/CMP-N,N'-diacetyllegionaminic acid synthase
VLNNKILAIIPARGGSKGLPNKNIKLLNGIPLIGYTIKEAFKSRYINRIVVSTDDNEIAKIAKSYNAEVPYSRPIELSTDSSLTIDSVIHMLNFLKKKENYVPDYVCLLQCTSPFRTFEDIDNSVKKLLGSNFEGIISVCEVDENPYWTNIFEGNKLKYFIEEGKKISRRQDLPKVYSYNGAIYIMKTDTLLKHRTFETENITGYIMPKEKSIDIDTPLDFQFAEILMRGIKK